MQQCSSIRGAGDNGCSQLVQCSGVVGVDTRTWCRSFHSLAETNTMKTFLQCQDFKKSENIRGAVFCVQRWLWVFSYWGRCGCVSAVVNIGLHRSHCKKVLALSGAFSSTVRMSFFSQTLASELVKLQLIAQSCISVCPPCEGLAQKTIQWPNWSNKGVFYSVSLSLMGWLHNMVHHPATRQPNSVTITSVSLHVFALDGCVCVSTPPRFHPSPLIGSMER